LKEIKLFNPNQEEFDKMCEEINIHSLTIGNCKIKDYSKISNLKELIKFEIISSKNFKFDFFSKLTKIEKLKIKNMPELEDITSLKYLVNLKELEIDTPPSWDTSGKTLLLNNLDVLSLLTKLERIRLMKVTVKENGLKGLIPLKNLKVFETDNTFEMEEFTLLAKNLPNTKCLFFEPSHEVCYVKCKKCGNNKHKLTLKGNRFLCPNCQEKKLEEYKQKFYQIKNK